MPRLKLDTVLVDEARTLAQYIVTPIIEYSSQRTTVTIERATLRLIGVDGVDEEGVPLPNRVVEQTKGQLSGGVLRPFVATMMRHMLDVQETAEAIGCHEVQLEDRMNISLAQRSIVDAEGLRLVRQGVERIRQRCAKRDRLLEDVGGNPPTPWLYVIVATGNIYEDIIQWYYHQYRGR